MNSEILSRLNKNHGLRRDFCSIVRTKLFGRFHTSANTTSTHHFAYLPTVFENRHLLQIWSEFSIGRSHRKAAIMTKCRCFSTFFTFRHDKDPFNYKCLELAGFCTSQQGCILPYPETFYKISVL